MRKPLLLSSVCAVLLIAASALAQVGPASELAPNGKLRAALVGSNPILVVKKSDGALAGVSIDLGKFIAERLGATFELIAYPDTDAYAKSFSQNAWEVAIGPRTPVAEAHSAFSPDFYAGRQHLCRSPRAAVCERS